MHEWVEERVSSLEEHAHLELEHLKANQGFRCKRLLIDKIMVLERNIKQIGAQKKGSGSLDDQQAALLEQYEMLYTTQVELVQFYGNKKTSVVMKAQ